MSNQPVDGNRIRPGLVALLAGLIALILVSLWLHSHGSQPAGSAGTGPMGRRGSTFKSAADGEAAFPGGTTADISTGTAATRSRINGQAGTLAPGDARGRARAGLIAAGASRVADTADADPGVARENATEGQDQRPSGQTASELSAPAGGGLRASSPSASGGGAASPAVTVAPDETGATGDQPDPPGPVEAKWGIRLASIGLAQANGAVELIYQVTGYDKAGTLAGNKSKNYLIDLASGAEIAMLPSQTQEWPFPQHSGARSAAMATPEAGTFPPPPNRLVVGRPYALLIPNPNGLIKKGSLVAVVVGGVRSEELKVE